MKRVYIAGPYSAPDVLSVFKNMKAGMDAAVGVRHAGFSPFCPWMDFMYFFMNQGEPFSLENCYEYSLDWLEVSDYILFIKGWKNSGGAIKEYHRAKELGKPCFFSLDDLIKWDSSDSLDEYYRSIATGGIENGES